MGYQRITRVVIRSARRSHAYRTRFHIGRLRRYPASVVALSSKRKPRDARPAYFLCSDTTLSVRTIWKFYGFRMSCARALRGARLRRAAQDAHTLVLAAYAFVQTQCVTPLLTDPTAKLQPLGDVLRTHQAAHVRHTVCHIAGRFKSPLTNRAAVP